MSLENLVLTDGSLSLADWRRSFSPRDSRSWLYLCDILDDHCVGNFLVSAVEASCCDHEPSRSSRCTPKQIEGKTTAQNSPPRDCDLGEKHIARGRDQTVSYCKKVICCPDDLPCSSETRRQFDHVHCATRTNR